MSASNNGLPTLGDVIAGIAVYPTYPEHELTLVPMERDGPEQVDERQVGGGPYETRTLSLIVKPKGEPVSSEGATTVTLAEDGEGPFVEVAQHRARGSMTIQIDVSEWPQLRAAIDSMVAECATMVGRR